MSLWIKRRAAPVGSATDSRQRHGAFDRWWCKKWPNVPVLHRLKCRLAKFWGEVNQITLRETLLFKRRRPCGEWLGRRRSFPLERAGRNRLLFDGPNGFPRDSIKDVEEPGLADLGNGLNGLPFNDKVGDHGSRGQVVVPDIVMDSLIMPEPFASTSVEGDHGGAE